MKKELFIPTGEQRLFIPAATVVSPRRRKFYGIGEMLVVPGIVGLVAAHMTLQFPKWIPDARMDALLADIDAATEEKALVSYAAGDSYATIVSGSNDCATATLAAGDTTIADGDTSGRKITIAAKSGVTIDASGTVTHVAIADGTNVDLVTTCTSQALTAAGTVNFPSWKHEVADPT